MKTLIILLICSSSLIAAIGKVYALQGEGSLQRASIDIPITLGTEIEEKDSIITNNQTKMQIVFNDRTIVTLGDKTHFKIDSYHFDTKENSHVNFTLKRGALKSMTGTIGKWSPQDFTIKTATAKIGVNGTTLILKVTDKQTTLATLSGETTFNNTGSHKKLTVKENKQLIQNNQSKRVHITSIQSGDIQLGGSSSQRSSNRQGLNKLSSNNQENGSDVNQMNVGSLIEDNTATLAFTTLNTKRFKTNSDTQNTNTSTTTTTVPSTKVTVNSDTHYSYGYWDTKGVAATPFSEGDIIASSVVGSYTALADYSGNVVSIRDGLASTTGSIYMSVDFSANYITGGSLNITDSANQTWYVTINGGTFLSGNNFTLNSSDMSNMSGSMTYTSGTLNGTFYGTGTTNPVQNQDGVSGTFTLTGSNAGTSTTIEGAYGAINTGQTLP